MNKKNKIRKNLEDKIVLYTNTNGDVELRADVDKGTMWATQAQLARIFDVNSQAVTKHLKNIYSEGELTKNSTCSKMEQVQLEGGRGIRRFVDFYNLDAIIAVGYRVNSKKATQFRIWATIILRNYLTKGYNLNKYTLENADEKFDDLHEAIAFMESKKEGEVVKGKMTIRLSKTLVR